MAIYLQWMKRRITSNKFFLFQRATRGIERDVYEKLIAPYKNDLLDSYLNGFRRVCADQKFALIGFNILYNELARELSCQVVPLPDTIYRDKWALLITKNSPYKGLINWRWDNKIKSTRYTTNSSLQLWVPWKLPNTKDMFTDYLETRVLTWGRYDRFVPFLKCHTWGWL